MGSYSNSKTVSSTMARQSCGVIYQTSFADDGRSGGRGDGHCITSHDCVYPVRLGDKHGQLVLIHSPLLQLDLAHLLPGT
eukprot:scaffold167667_cov31-Tisochrysis_lutea.AAC.1